MPQLNYGYREAVIDASHYVFGDIKNKLVLEPLGHWVPYIPDYEPQFENFETDGCTVWGTENAIEFMDRRVFSKPSNYSDRFLCDVVPVRVPTGSDPHTVAETIRHVGLVDQDRLTNLVDTYAEFIKPVPCDLLPIAQNWVSQFNFGHEWLWTKPQSKIVRKAKIKDALRYSPLGISVTAWFAVDGLYVDGGIPNCHWCVLFETIETADDLKFLTDTLTQKNITFTVPNIVFNGDLYPVVFDSYDQSVKVLHPDHNIQMAKSYSLSAKTLGEEKSPNWLLDLFGGLFKTQPEPLGAVDCISGATGLGFNTDLSFGMDHPDVLRLQEFLNSDSATLVATFGSGSPGQEIEHFGTRTQMAVIKFQQKYNIKPAAGYVGPITRGIINNLLKTMSPAEKLYETAKSQIGIDLAPGNELLGCAITMSAIHNMAFPDQSPLRFVNTSQWLYFVDNSPLWQRIVDPQPGCLILGSTEQIPAGSPVSHAHIGVVGHNLADDGSLYIISNNSDKKYVDTQWTVNKWKTYFEDYGKIETYYYIKVA